MGVGFVRLTGEALIGLAGDFATEGDGSDELRLAGDEGEEAAAVDRVKNEVIRPCPGVSAALRGVFLFGVVRPTIVKTES